jgi:hypothetical protein
VIRHGKEDHGILAVLVNLLSYPGLAPEIHARSTDPALKREDTYMVNTGKNQKESKHIYH